jgi:hypothetical protein
MKITDKQADMISNIMTAFHKGDMSFISEQVINDLIDHGQFTQRVYIDENGEIKSEYIPYESTKD